MVQPLLVVHGRPRRLSARVAGLLAILLIAASALPEAGAFRPGPSDAAPAAAGVGLPGGPQQAGPPYSLTISPKPAGGTVRAAGIVCGDGGAACVVTVNQPSTIGMSASASAGYQFVQWTGGCAGTVPGLWLWVDGAKTCSAVFQLIGGGTPTNRPPTASAGGPYSGTAGQTINFAGSGTDPDGDALTYAWTFSDGGSAAGASATHVFAAAGTYTATLTVGDGKGGTASATAAVTVAAAGGGGVPPAGPPYSMTILPTTGGRVQAAGINCGAGGTACWVPLQGASTLGMVATPSEGYAFKQWSGHCAGTSPSRWQWVSGPLTCSAVFELIGGGTPTNRAPTASAGGPYSGTAGQAIAFAGSGSDPDGDTLTYAWTFSDGGNSAGASPTHAFASAGNFTATLTVGDGKGGTASATASVSVAAAGGGGTPPTGPPYTLTIALPAGGQVQGAGINCGAGATTCAVTMPAAMTLGLTATPSRGYRFTVWTGDCTGTTAGLWVQLNGQRACGAIFTLEGAPANRPPTANAGGPYAGTAGQAINFAGSGTDPDGDALTYAWTFSDGGSASGASATHTFAIAGNYTATLTVSDGKGGTASATAAVTVTAVPPPPVNHPPTAGAGGPYSGTAGQAIAFTGSGTDPDGDALAYAWTFSDGGSASGGSVSHTFASAGNYTATITVSDGKGGTASATAAVTVTAEPPPPPTNQSPTARITGPASGTVGQAVSVDGSTSTDPDSDPLTYAWALGDGGTAAGASASHTYAAAGTFTVTLTVNDGRGGTNSTTASVRIDPPANRQPTAHAGGPYAGEVSTSVQFSGAQSRDADGDALVYAWDFGDGAKGSGQGPSHAYAQAGTFTATLTVSDAAGATATSTASVTITAAADRSPPVVSLTAPREALPGTPVTLTADASDNVGVVSVVIDVEGESPQTITAPPYQRAITLPQIAAPGTTVRVTATARDAAGNAGSAVATITIASQPDTENPTVSMSAPAEAAAGATVTVTAAAQDNTGVASVALLVDGAPVATLTAPPYQFSWQVPPASQPGTSFALLVRATDYVGHTGDAIAALTVSTPAAADTQPPTVTLSLPPSALPGSTIELSATAADNVGVAAVAFFVDGARISTSFAPPYRAAYTVPTGLLAGANIRAEARATDGVGLTASDIRTASVTAAAAPGQGLVYGRVYDDGTGLAVEGASITLRGTSAAGQAYTQAAVTDARGGYVIAAPEGQATLRVTKSGMTSVDRTVAFVADGGARRVFDARLTPLAAAVTITAIAGGSVERDGVRLTLGAGALSNNASIAVTSVSGQGLQGLLPIGWSPLAVVDLTPHGLAFSDASALSAPNASKVPSSTPVVLAAWDESASAWRALDGGQIRADGTAFEGLVPATGQYAWLVADSVPAAPAQPAANDLLAGLTAADIPADAASAVSPNPKVLFYNPGVRSVVTGSVTTASLLSSGTPVALRLAESYRFMNGSEAHPEPMLQDLVFYQAPGASGQVRGVFTVTPSLAFEAITLQSGVITVELQAPGTASPLQVVSTSGGHIDGPAGERLDVPAGALAQPVPMELRAIESTDIGVTLPDGLTPLGGVSLSFAGELAQPAILSIAKPAGAGSAGQILLARVADIRGETRLVVAARARFEGDRLIADITLPGSADTFEGVRSGGRYLFVQAESPLGFSSGLVSGVTGQPFAGALVAQDRLPVVAFSNAAGRYAQAMTGGSAAHTAIDLQKNDMGTGTATVIAGLTTTIDLTLVAQPPTVVSVSPAEGATGVALTDPVIVRFSESVNPATVTVQTILLTGPTGNIAGTLSLSSNDTVATLRPSEPLAPNAAYTITIAATISDVAGYTLGSAVAKHFTSLDTAPPAMPPAGSLSATIPGTGGTTTVTGTQGTAGLHDTVTIVNVTKGTSTPALVDPNGGFSAIVTAARTDTLKVEITDPSGNKTVIDLAAFRQVNADGSVSQAVGELGGRVEGAGGVIVDVPMGTFPGGTVVTVGAVAEADFPVQLAAEERLLYRYAGGVRLDFNGAAPTRYVNVSIPAQAGDTADDQWVVSEAVYDNGVPVLNVVDTAKLIDGRVATSSPPCPGVTGAGIYGVHKFGRPFGVNVIQMASETAYARRVRLNAEYVNEVGELTGSPMPFGMFTATAPPSAICLPVLSGRATVSQNTQVFTVDAADLAPADRAVVVKNLTRNTETRVPRNVTEYRFNVPGSTSDVFEVLLHDAAASVDVTTAFQLAGAASGMVQLVIDVDTIEFPVDGVRIRNVSRDPVVDITYPQVMTGMDVPAGGDPGDSFETTIVRADGTTRTVTATQQPPAYGAGNLLLRVMPHTIDPTQKQIDDWNATHPPSEQITGEAVVSIILSEFKENVLPGGDVQLIDVQQIGVPLPLVEAGEGGLAFAFSGTETNVFRLLVRYETQDHQPGKAVSIPIPAFRLSLVNAATGRVVKMVKGQAPPKGALLNLGTVSDDLRPPILVEVPDRLPSFDPAQSLTFVFSEPLDPATLAGNVMLEKVGSGGAVTAISGTSALSLDGRTLTFTPDQPLQFAAEYQLTLLGKDSLAAVLKPGHTGGLADRAGNGFGTTRLQVKTFKPTLVGSDYTGMAGGRTDPGYPLPLEWVKDIAIQRRSVNGKPQTVALTVMSTQEGFKTVAFDVTDAAAPVEIGHAQGGRVRFALTFAPGLSFPLRDTNPCDPSKGKAFEGDLLVATYFNQYTSGVQFVDVTDPTRPCPLGMKILTANPEYLGNGVDQPGTVKQLAFPRGVAVLSDQASAVAYVAVEQVGLMAVDIGANIPEVFPRDRRLERIHSGDYWDVTAFHGNLLAVDKSNQRLDIIDSGFTVLGSVPVTDLPRRVIGVEAFPVDLDGDGEIWANEYRDLALVGGEPRLPGSTVIDIVDITSLTAPAIVGDRRMPGIIRDLDIDPAQLRLFVTGNHGDQPFPQALFMVDLRTAATSGFADSDSDGLDDRILWHADYAEGVGAVRVDQNRGVAYVGRNGAAGNRGLDVWSLYDNCCDLGIEAGTARRERKVGDRATELIRERDALRTGITAGLAAAAACGYPGLAEVTLLEQGSGACLWAAEPWKACGTNYQPGISDHDFEAFFPAGAAPSDQSCVTTTLREAFVDAATGQAKPITLPNGSSLRFLDITFFPMSKAGFEAAKLDLEPPKSTGGDVIGDMGLGRQGLLLKWLLEGEYVDAGGPPAGTALEDILTILRTETKIPAVEGFEFATVQELALNKSTAFIRLVGAADPLSRLHERFQKQVHDAAKAGVRAAFARLVADDYARPRVLDVTREAYRSGACLQIDDTRSPLQWNEKPCESFEEYIASAAARTVRAPFVLPLFTIDDVRQIHRFFRVKSDLERIPSDAAADAFVRAVAAFIARVETDTAPIYTQALASDPDAAQRQSNMATARKKVAGALTGVKVPVDAFVFNHGFRNASDIRIAMYTGDAPGSGTLVAAQLIDLAGGDQRSFDAESTKFVLGPLDQTADLGVVHAVSLTIDLPGKTVKERDRSNNVGGFYYYVLDRTGAAAPAVPPALPLPMPDPGGDLLDPDAACDASATDIPFSQVMVVGNEVLDGLANLAPGQTATVRLRVQNTSGQDLTGVRVCSNITGECYDVGTISNGATWQQDVSFTAPDDGKLTVGRPTVYSAERGLTSGPEFYLSTFSCEPYQLVPLQEDPNPEASEIMLGGTAHRYYRLIERRTGLPAPATAMTFEMSESGGAATAVHVLSDARGIVDIAIRAEDAMAPPKDITDPGRPFQVTLKEIAGTPSSCDPTAFALNVKDRNFSKVYARGLGIEGSVGLLGFSVKGVFERGYELEHDHLAVSGDKGLNISRSTKAGAGFGFEWSKDKKSSLVLAELKSEFGVSASVDKSQGWDDKYGFPLPLDAKKNCAIAKLTLDGMAGSHPFIMKLADLLRGSTCDEESYKTSTGSSFETAAKGEAKASLGITPFQNANAKTQDRKTVGVTFGVTGSDEFSLGFKYSGELGTHPGTNATGFIGQDESYSLKGGVDLSAGLSAAASDPADPPGDKEEKEEKDKLEIELFKSSLDLTGSVSRVEGYSVKFSQDWTKDWADPTRPRVRDNPFLPDSISITYTAPKQWGWKADAFGFAQDLGSGSTGDLTYTIDREEDVRLALTSLQNLDQIQQASIVQNMIGTVMLGPTTLSDEYKKFKDDLLPQMRLSYSRAKEWGRSSSVPLKLKFENKATGIKLGLGFDMKSEYKVSTDLERGAIRAGRPYPLEVYTKDKYITDPTDDYFDLVQLGIDALIDSFTTDLSAVGATVDPSGPPVELKSTKTATLQIDASREPAAFGAALFSWMFRTQDGPVASGRLLPSDVTGPAGAPHYGVGGFHQFEPLGYTLAVPTPLVIDYKDEDIAGLDESTFAIFRWNFTSGDWEHVGGVVDAAANTVTVPITTFGQYTIAPIMPAREIVLDFVAGPLVGTGEAATRQFTVTSGPIVLNTGQTVPDGTLFTVRAVSPGDENTSFGTILTLDADTGREFVQVASVGGRITFDVNVPQPRELAVPCRAAVYSAVGTAFGDTVLMVVK